MSQELVIGAVALAVVDTSISNLKKTTTRAPAMKIVLGGFVTVVALLLVSEASEDIADTVAVIILLSTLFGPTGGALADLVTKVTKSDSVSTAPKTTPIVQSPTYVDPNAAWYLS